MVEYNRDAFDKIIYEITIIEDRINRFENKFYNLIDIEKYKKIQILLKLFRNQLLLKNNRKIDKDIILFIQEEFKNFENKIENFLNENRKISIKNDEIDPNSNYEYNIIINKLHEQISFISALYTSNDILDFIFNSFFEKTKISLEKKLDLLVDENFSQLKESMDENVKELQIMHHQAYNGYQNFLIITSTVDNNIKNLQEEGNDLRNDINKSLKEIHELGRIINSLETNVEKSYKNTLETTTKKIEEEFRNVVSSFSNELDETDRLIQHEVSSIKETSQSFKEFIGDETAIKMTNDYKNKSFWEMIMYYIFTGLSIIVIILAFCLSWHTLDNFITDHKSKEFTQLDLIFLSIRLIFSIIIFSTVAFTSRLAARSYLYWKKNEGIYLRLTALKPFIADMEPAKKTEIHEKLVDVYFGKDHGDHSLNEKIKDLPKNISDLLGKVVDNAASFSESVTGKKDGQKSSTEADNK